MFDGCPHSIFFSRATTWKFCNIIEPGSLHHELSVLKEEKGGCFIKHMPRYVCGRKTSGNSVVIDMTHALPGFREHCRKRTTHGPTLLSYLATQSPTLYYDTIISLYNSIVYIRRRHAELVSRSLALTTTTRRYSTNTKKHLKVVWFYLLVTEKCYSNTLLPVKLLFVTLQ